MGRRPTGRTKTCEECARHVTVWWRMVAVPRRSGPMRRVLLCPRCATNPAGVLAETHYLRRDERRDA